MFFTAIHDRLEHLAQFGWSCLEQRYHGAAQDGEVQLWDCRHGSAEALLSDTPSVASHPL